MSYSIANAETKDREVSSLLKVAKHLNAKRLIIITYNEEQIIEVNDNVVEVIPLWKWLLCDKSISQ